MNLITDTLKPLICGFLILIAISGFTQNQPPDITMVFYVDENTENGALIGTVSATDPDEDELTFSITSGNETSAFALDPATGDLTVQSQSVLDFETTPVFNLIIEIDDGNGGITIAAVDINLIDIDENVLGIENDKQDLKVYLDASQRYLHITTHSTRARNYSIHTMNGNLVDDQSIKSSSPEVVLDVGSLKPGVYIVRSHDDREILWGRIVIR